MEAEDVANKYLITILTSSHMVTLYHSEPPLTLMKSLLVVNVPQFFSHDCMCSLL